MKSVMDWQVLQYVKYGQRDSRGVTHTVRPHKPGAEGLIH